MGKYFQVNLKMSFFFFSAPKKKKKLMNRKKSKSHCRKSGKSKKIYIIKNVECYQLRRKPDTRAEFHPKAFEVIGYNKNLGEITTFGMKMSTEARQTRISL